MSVAKKEIKYTQHFCIIFYIIKCKQGKYPNLTWCQLLTNPVQQSLDWERQKAHQELIG